MKTRLINIELKYWPLFLALLGTMVFYSCETEFIPDGTDLEEEIVVEGYIEAGVDATPPFLFITKSVSFFNEFDPAGIEDLFVHDAAVKVFDGENEYSLNEFCLDEIPENLKPIILEALGFDPDSLNINLCVYLDLLGGLTGEVGKKYDLTINLADERVLTASTTIPPHVPLNELKFIKPSETAADTLLELRSIITDEANRKDYYRYFTAINGEAFRAPFQSVVDDAFFDGQEFEFPLAKAEPLQQAPDIETFGLFQTGDTASIKWANMDAEHFEFWSTLEFNAVSQGPFSSYTQVVTNIEGGLGIWGGYSTSQYQIVVEE